MTTTFLNRAMSTLHYTIGLVVAWQSITTAWMAFPEIHYPGHRAVHAWIRLLLGSFETVGAALFLLRGKIGFAGGCILIAVFAFAILFHALRGEFESGALLVYLAATLVCMASLNPPARG